MFSDSVTHQTPKLPNPSLSTPMRVFWGQKNQLGYYFKKKKKTAEKIPDKFIPAKQIKITTGESSPQKGMHTFHEAVRHKNVENCKGFEIQPLPVSLPQTQ